MSKECENVITLTRTPLDDMRGLAVVVVHFDAPIVLWWTGVRCITSLYTIAGTPSSRALCAIRAKCLFESVDTMSVTFVGPETRHRLTSISFAGLHFCREQPLTSLRTQRMDKHVYFAAAGGRGCFSQRRQLVDRGQREGLRVAPGVRCHRQWLV